MRFDEFLDYDQFTGELTWKERPRMHFRSHQGWRNFNSQFAGKRAGTDLILDGRIYRKLDITIDGVKRAFLSHRVAWEIMHGPIPSGIEIDHIDRNGSNNAISNLRLATRSENARNIATRRDSTSGLKGVEYCPRTGRYRAYININKKRVHLGRFATPELASAARARAAIDLHGEFADLGSFASGTPIGLKCTATKIVVSK